MPEEPRRSSCPHYQPGDPLVCGNCAYARTGLSQASLTPQQLENLRRYSATAAAQGRRDLDEISILSPRPGEPFAVDRAGPYIIGASRPEHLPPSYPYPTSIDGDSAFGPTPTAQNLPQGQSGVYGPGPNSQNVGATQPYSGSSMLYPSDRSFDPAARARPARVPRNVRRTSQSMQNNNSRRDSHPGGRPSTTRISATNRDDQADEDSSDDDQ